MAKKTGRQASPSAASPAGDPPGFKPTNLPVGTAQRPGTVPPKNQRDASGRLKPNSQPGSGITFIDPALQDWRPEEELGATGLRQWSGIVREELLPKLTGVLGLTAFREMSDNDPVIGASLLTIDLIARRTGWRVEAAGDKGDDRDAAAFLESCRHDMAQTWTDHISEALTMLPFGWSMFEIVYKVRSGPTDDPHTSSRFNDHRIGIRKLSIRSQDTLYRWQFDRTGGIQGMIQRPPPDYWERFIPIDKALLYRTKMRKNNPEGVSILRNAYRPWFHKKRIEEIQGIGIERDLNGLPIAWVPPQLLGAGATAADKALLEVIKKIVTNVRNDEQAGIVMPLAYNDKGGKLFDFALLSAPGKRNFDTNAILQYYDLKIAMALMSDFLMLGHGKVGSYNLGESKLSAFSAALGAYLDQIQDVQNRYLVPRLFALNGWKLESLPRIVHEPVEEQDMDSLSKMFTALAAAGMPLFPDGALEDHIRHIMHLPARPQPQTPEDAEEQSEAADEGLGDDDPAAGGNGKPRAPAKPVGQSGPVARAPRPAAANASGKPGAVPAGVTAPKVEDIQP